MKKETENSFSGEGLLCPIRYSIDAIGGKWKAQILCILADRKAHRYNEMKRKLGKITNTMLAQTLQQLESDCLIHRKQYNKIPPKVEYRLTLEGETIIPVLLKMAEWGAIHMKMDKEFSSECDRCRKIY